MALEQANQAFFLHLRETFVNERPHVALVILVRAKDIEIFQAHNLVQKTGTLGVQIEKVFGIAIHVKRPQRVEHQFIVFHALGTVAVSCCGRRIDKPRFVSQGPMRQLFGKLIIIPGQIRGVLFRGGGTSTHVENEIEFSQRTVLQARQQVGGFDVISETQRRQIAPFFVRPQDVTNHDAVATAPVQRPNQCAADKTGTAGD